jgi:uncharacterized protein (TIGR02996 family)
VRGSRAPRGGDPEAGEGARLNPLLAAIIADPDDDRPRLVYADWLLDRGDVRGELIQLQVRGVDDARQRELVAAHGAEWTLPFEPFFDMIPPAQRLRLFRRGFVEQLFIEGPRGVLDLVARQDRIFGATPLLKLGFIGFDTGTLAVLRESPYLPRLRELVLGGVLDAAERAAMRALLGDRLRT